MLQLFAVRAQSAALSSLRGAGAPARTPAKAPVKKPAAKAPAAKTPAKKPVPPKKPVTPGLGQDKLTLTPKPPVAPPPPPPPVVPVAETVEKAVAAALAGEAIRVAVPQQTEPSALKLKALEGTGQYELELGAQKFTVAIAEGQTSEAALVRALQVVTQMAPDQRKAALGLRIEEVGAEADRFTLESLNTAGSPVSVSFRRTGMEGDLAVYDMTADGHTVKLKAALEEDLPWELARAGALYSEVSPRHRKVLKTVVINNGPNPLDAYWAKEYNMPDFASAASAGQGVINFWRGHGNLYDDNFTHELGHLIGQTISKENSYVPKDWAEAIASDGNSPSVYATASPTEDFAESWSMFVRVKAGKSAFRAKVKDEAEFVAKYPARSKVLQAIYDQEVAPASKGGGASRIEAARASMAPCNCHGCGKPAGR